MPVKKDKKKQTTTLLLLANLLADEQNSYGQNFQTWSVDWSFEKCHVHKLLVIPTPADRFNLQNPGFIPTWLPSS